MSELLLTGAIIAFILAFVLNLAAVLTWMERKQSALMQDRIGANRADLFGFRAIGLFHIAADGMKMFLKEDFVPKHAIRLFHLLAPCLSAFFALAVFAVVPFGAIPWQGEVIYLQLADPDAGMLFVFAMMSFSFYGVFLAGWASRNNYAFLGGLRGVCQLLSYEIVLGISLVGLIMIYGTLSLREMVEAQGALLFGVIPMWGILLQPVAFVVFLTAGIADTKRVPFDLPEGESEIIGYFTEYSSMRFGLFFLTDFIEVVIVGVLVTVFFLGGWLIPGLGPTGLALPGGGLLALPEWAVGLFQVAGFGLKVFLVCWLQLAIRWTLPRFRYDQLMRLCWKYLLPVVLVNIAVTGLVLVW